MWYALSEQRQPRREVKVPTDRSGCKVRASEYLRYLGFYEPFKVALHVRAEAVLWNRAFGTLQHRLLGNAGADGRAVLAA